MKLRHNLPLLFALVTLGACAWSQPLTIKDIFDNHSDRHKEYRRLPVAEKEKFLPDILPYLRYPSYRDYASGLLREIPADQLSDSSRQLLCAKLLPSVPRTAPDDVYWAGAFDMAMTYCPKDDVVEHLSLTAWLSAAEISALQKINTTKANDFLNARNKENEREERMQPIIDKREQFIDTLIHGVFAEDFAYGEALQSSRGISGNLGGRISISWQDDNITKAKVMVDFRGHAMMGGGVGSYHELMVTCSQTKCEVTKYLKDGAWVEGRILTNHRRH